MTVHRAIAVGEAYFARNGVAQLGFQALYVVRKVDAAHFRFVPAAQSR